MTSTATSTTKVPRKASRAFLVVALLVGGLFLAAGVAATTTNSLAPFVRGLDFAQERHLSRDSVTLALHVGFVDDAGALQRAEGATVTLSRADTDERVAVKTTDAQGRALFHLRPGGYHGALEFDGMTAAKDFRIFEDLRAIVVFDQDGNAHFVDRDRRDLQRQGQTHTLSVGVRQADEAGNATPVEDAIVRVYRLERDDGTTSGEPVARAATGPRGHAVFSLPKGAYVVQVVVGDHSGRAQVMLDADKAVGFFFDADGQAHVRNADAARTNAVRGDGTVSLGVQVATENGRAAGGAFVQVYQIRERGDEGVLVARAAAEDEGLAAFILEPGAYRVVATMGELTGQHALNMGDSQDQRIRVVVS